MSVNRIGGFPDIHVVNVALAGGVLQQQYAGQKISYLQIWQIVIAHIHLNLMNTNLQQTILTVFFHFI